MERRLELRVVLFDWFSIGFLLGFLLGFPWVFLGFSWGFPRVFYGFPTYFPRVLCLMVFFDVFDRFLLPT